ncbi:MAG: pyridoxal-dependent aspartate 1-decarboxylase PanP [Thermodesulfobacteriota bacterium]
MSRHVSSEKNAALVADWQALRRIFLRPENDAARATLLKYMEQILFGLHDFLKEHVGITEEASLKNLADRHVKTRIGKHPEKKLAAVITDLVQNIAPHAVNVASPYFVGHMTSAIPFFMVHLKTIVAALNQNVVKLETSKVVSIVEKQVLAKLHRLIYDRSESFYNTHVQNTHTTLGAFVEGGTTANLTALWVARNTLLAPKKGFRGIEKEGLSAAYAAYDLQRCVVLVSRRGHYSLRKAGGLLGIGNENVIAVDVDKHHRIDTLQLRKQIDALLAEGRTRIMAVIGIAGTTETGSVDPLRELAGICREHGIHFHVDAAWGGPVLMSEKYRHLLDGIELADSVTIDGHKQFYMTMGCGMVYFKNPRKMDAIAYHANYVNRPGSVDLGIKSLAGTREANSLVMDCALKIMGTQGYALLLEHGIELAKQFAAEISRRPLFQLVTAPTLNILTYRICPPQMQKELYSGPGTLRKNVNKTLNAINRTVQRIQREAGRSFVSRTTLNRRSPDAEIVVLRVVLMNPMTDIAILNDILDEQEAIYRSRFSQHDGFQADPE